MQCHVYYTVTCVLGSICLYAYIYLSIYIIIYHLLIYLSIDIYIIHPPTYLSTSLHVYRYLYLSVCLSEAFSGEVKARVFYLAHS